MDVLDYDYDSGNKLTKVTDGGNDAHGFKDGTNTNDDFGYDINGNLKIDRNKGITDIEYNHLNLPTRIDFGGDDIRYVYAADGTKLKKTVSTGSETLYANGYVYEGNADNAQLQFFGHPEGYVYPDANGNFRYVYNYLDHLGSVRLSYTDADGNGSIDPANEIVERNDYYPFGLKREQNDPVSPHGSPTAKKWKYGNEEFEEDLGKNTVAYQWRDYDPTIGRFNKIDRFSEKYERLSPYQFSANNPIYFREIAGDSLNLTQLFSRNEDGNYTNQKAVEAFQFFAGTKEGKSYLSQFASEGQSIEGTDITFGSDGKYHSDGIDLAYNVDPLSASDSRDAETGYTEEDNGRLSIDVSLSNSNGFGGVLDVTHESFIHADKYATDFSDNGVMDYSNLNKFVNERYKKVNRQHIYTKVFERREYKGLFANQGFSIMLQVNKKYNENKTRTEVWNTMYDYVD